MPSFNIVLVEPEIPQNTGNIVRTCAATGASLHLVKPLGFTIDDKKLKRAGLDYWWLMTPIKFYDGLDDFFSKNSGPFFYFSTKARHVHSEVRYHDGCYLVFGKETAGLPEELLLKNEDC
ncbi:MAG TPA: tRNA (cytidine(34)-2'-O)-methyltransferase, partial [Ruminiclostridium sp.]|nr:tRNA (cytidine(34)-2'-O)-methyltransferase [Ruminiclostridium sp.]